MSKVKITDEKLIKELLRQNEESKQSIKECLLDSVTVIDKDNYSVFDRNMRILNKLFMNMVNNMSLLQMNKDYEEIAELLKLQEEVFEEVKE